MEPLPGRQMSILALAREMGRVQVDELASKFNVSVQTIRKDLNDLCERSYLQRIHGGALYPTGASNFGYEARRNLAALEKQLIGARAASLVPNNSAIILNIGTTTEQVALALRRHEGLMVITNNMNVANILRDSRDMEVLITGGIVRSSDGGITGSSAIEFISQFKVDYAIIGTSAIDQDGTLLDFDFREVRVSQEIIRQARKTILVADSTKFDRRAPVQIASLDSIDIFVTDRPPPPAIAAFCRDHGVTVEVCGGADPEREGAVPSLEDVLP